MSFDFDRHEKRMEKIFNWSFGIIGATAVLSMLISLLLAGLLCYALYLLITSQLPL